MVVFPIMGSFDNDRGRSTSRLFNTFYYIGGPGGKIKKRTEISNFADAFSRRFAESF